MRCECLARVTLFIDLDIMFLTCIITNPLKKYNVSVCLHACVCEFRKEHRKNKMFLTHTHTHAHTVIWLLIEKVRDSVCDSSSFTIQLYNEFDLMNSPVFFEKRNSFSLWKCLSHSVHTHTVQISSKARYEMEMECDWLIATEHQRMAWMNTNQPADGGHH